MAEIRHHIADEEGQMFAHMPEDPQQLLEPENQRSTPWGAQEITAAVDAVAREQLLLSPEGALERVADRGDAFAPVLSLT